MNIYIFLQSGFQLCTRKWFGIASGLHREWLGEVGEKFRFLSPTSPNRSRGNLEEISNQSRTSLRAPGTV